MQQFHPVGFEGGRFLHAGYYCVRSNCSVFFIIMNAKISQGARFLYAGFYGIMFFLNPILLVIN